MVPDLSPLSLFLVKMGGNGDRVLFRYPYSEPPKKLLEHNHASPNAFAITTINEDVANNNKRAAHQRLDETNIISFESKVLSNAFAVKTALCGSKFELKVDDVRFVGHPTNLEMSSEERCNYPRHSTDQFESSLTMVHIVFALSTSANYSVVRLYHELSKVLAHAIRSEERRTGFLTLETRLMLSAQDELSPSQTSVSPFALALDRSQLARDLKKVFEDISSTGIVNVRFNGWSHVSFCLPQKVHKKINPSLVVEPEAIFKCLDHLRPYHALLLLQDAKELLDELPIDVNAAIVKVVQQASPLKNFITLALDADVSKSMVFKIASQLVYWGKATVVYPLCNTNMYVVSPSVPNLFSPVLIDKFAESFPGEHLTNYLAIFSLPNSLNEALPTIAGRDSMQLLARVVVWCLQHHLLVQLHTYITLAINDDLTSPLKDPIVADDGEGNGVSLNKEDDLENQDRPILVNENGAQLSVEELLKLSPVSVRETDFFAGKSRVGRGRTLVEILHAFSPEERDVIMAVPAAANLEDLRLFVKLSPYFNGRYHVEDIMYHENVRRSQLLQLLDKFRDVLITAQHEDPAITMYFSSSIK